MPLLAVEGLAPDLSEAWPRDWPCLVVPPRLGINESVGEAEGPLPLLPVLLLELSLKQASGQGDEPEERM